MELRISPHRALRSPVSLSPLKNIHPFRHQLDLILLKHTGHFVNEHLVVATGTAVCTSTPTSPLSLSSLLITDPKTSGSKQRSWSADSLPSIGGRLVPGTCRNIDSRSWGSKCHRNADK